MDNMLYSLPDDNISNNETSLRATLKLYVDAKEGYDRYKKVVDKYNKELKDILKEYDMTEYENDDYKVKMSVSERTTIKEDLLLRKLQDVKDKYPNLIKTKEYVDMDELENLIYKNELDSDTLNKVNSCVTIKEVVTLRATRQGDK